MRRDRDRIARDLAELLDDWDVDSPRPIDIELAPLARLAAELRDQAMAPPSPGRATVRAELVARHGRRRHRRSATLAILAGALMTLTAVVVVAALPLAEPVRDVVQNLFGSWIRPYTTPADTASPSGDPEGTAAPAPSLAAPITSAPADVQNGADATLRPSATDAASPVPGDGASPSARPEPSPPELPTPSAVVLPSPPRPTPVPTGPPWPQLPSPAVTPPPVP